MPHLFKGFKTSFAPKRRDSNEYDVVPVKELGRGAFAVVYQVHQKGLADNNDVAMRVVPLKPTITCWGLSTVKQLEERLEWVLSIQEAQRKATSHILTLYAYKITSSQVIFFNNLLSGGDLFDRITQSPGGCFSESDAREAAKSLLEAVDHLHKTGRMHRDIKPENIMYRNKESTNSELVLADFGLCLFDMGEHDTVDGMAGTSGYMAPEICAGQKYSLRVDEWSCGITVYEMLTGRSPFISTTPESMMEETMRRVVPFPRAYWQHLSQEAKDFTSALLDKDPKQRMTAAQGLEHPWLNTDSSDLPTISHSTSASSTDSSESAKMVAPLTLRRTRISMGFTPAAEVLQIDTKQLLEGDLPGELMARVETLMVESPVSV